jgi:hypothetical protein
MLTVCTDEGTNTTVNNLSVIHPPSVIATPFKRINNKQQLLDYK